MTKYPKLPLQLEYWCVSRKDFYMIFEFLRERFPGQPIDIIVETQSGDHHLFTNLQEFEEAIEVSLSLNDKIERILMYAREVKPEIGQRRFILFTVAFVFNGARFTIHAFDKEGELKNWTDESYKEMQRLFGLFRPSPEFQEILKRDFNLFYPERRRRTEQGVVVFDYDGNIKNRIHTELLTGPKPQEPETSDIGRRWIYDRSMWLGIISAVLLFALLVLTIYF
jgi:hypothetical protein